MTNILQAFDNAVRGDLSIIEEVEENGREERTLPVPSSFHDGRVKSWLESFTASNRGLWRHQSLALDAIKAGHNVIVATGTASGKSLIFQAAALQHIGATADATILVLYPLKALANDQFARWRAVARKANLPDNAIARIDGSVDLVERASSLRKAQIVAMTPDICHAWFMRNLSNPLVRNFLSRLDLIILDEAHVFESVFGSNVAYLLRRLQAARHIIQTGTQRKTSLQMIAASATIVNPADHLHKLTGRVFSVIDESEDGSPRHNRRLMHVSMRGNDGPGLREIISKLLENSAEGAMVVFRDSRQGVEKIAIDLEGVRPYRSGYEAEDRNKIERALRRGTLRAVISTSALELGIDIPHFAVGLNIDVPLSKKSFRQRLGRVGRVGPGIFAVIAEPDAFARFGSTFADYYARSIEPSHLYLENRFIQFAHARCLLDEFETLGTAARPQSIARVEWPRGFAEALEFARPGGARPREFDHIAMIGADAPHLNYPLRNVAEESFSICQGGIDESQRLGNVTLQQAVREAFPGATYVHLAKPFRVNEWRSTSFKRMIRVSRSKLPVLSVPIIRTFVNAALTRDGIVEGRLRRGSKGVLAECHLQITERVEGYRIGDKEYLYRELRQKNPAMTSKTREFRTTGVLLKIEDKWFKSVKRDIASGLRNLLQREYSISPRDIDAAATNVALVDGGVPRHASDTIVVYDAVYGSLRLTEPVFLELDRLLDLLERASQLAEDGGGLPHETVLRLRKWHATLSEADANAPLPIDVPDDGVLALAPGSLVAVRDMQGVLRDVEIIEPELVDLGNGTRLFYRYKVQSSNVRALIAHDAVELIGSDWTHIVWKPSTGKYLSS